MAIPMLDLMGSKMVLFRPLFCLCHSNPIIGDHFDDMDSAALLESLANFEPQPTHETPAPANANENHSFERLLEAAATAGGQEAQENGVETQPSSQVDTAVSRSNSRIDTPQSERTSSKRKRTGEPKQATPRQRPGKKQKTFETEHEALKAKEREIWGTEEYEEGDYDENHARYERTPGLKPRAMGVHSAAALFRRPSEKSRKYTRESDSINGYFIEAELLYRAPNGKTFYLSPDYRRGIPPTAGCGKRFHARPGSPRSI
jgi:hypothetical protein